MLEPSFRDDPHIKDLFKQGAIRKHIRDVDLVIAARQVIAAMKYFSISGDGLIGEESV